MDEPWGHNAQRSKSDKARQVLCDLTSVWNLKQQQQQQISLWEILSDLSKVKQKQNPQGTKRHNKELITKFLSF